MELCEAVANGVEVLPVTVDGSTWGGAAARPFPTIDVDVPARFPICLLYTSDAADVCSV